MTYIRKAGPTYGIFLNLELFLILIKYDLFNTSRRQAGSRADESSPYYLQIVIGDKSIGY